jgi:hypothetical protein
VLAGNVHSLYFTEPSDSPGDLPGLEYAFHCGYGKYGPFSLSNTAHCTTSPGDEGLRIVKGKVRDKDGGEREYSTVVRIDPVPARVLTGHVLWGGRPAQPNVLQSLPISLTLKSGPFERNFGGLTTDAAGFYTVPLTLVPPGTYSWRVKGPDGDTSTAPNDPTGFLANCGTIAIPDAPQTAMENGTMRTGDADRDNLIDVMDFMILRDAFGRIRGSAGYDSRADFDGDTTVQILDFTLMKANFGEEGCGPN